MRKPQSQDFPVLGKRLYGRNTLLGKPEYSPWLSLDINCRTCFPSLQVLHQPCIAVFSIDHSSFENSTKQRSLAQPNLDNMKNIIAISIVLFAACLVVHAEVETFYSDSTCTTAKTGTDSKGTQTWTGSGLCKTAVADPTTDGTSYHKFVCTGTAVALNIYSDNTCTGTASNTYDVTTIWPTIIAGGCFSMGNGEANKFDAVLSASSWGENCASANNAGRAAPMTLTLAIVCLVARLVF